MDVYYKVTNVSEDVVSWPWVKGLLTPQERIEYAAFTKTPEFLGIDEADRQAKKRTPDAIKARPFFEKLDKGVWFTEYVKDQKGATNTMKSLKWVVGPNMKEILKGDGAIYVLRDLCQRHEIRFSSNDTKDQLAEKVMEKFGENTTVLSRAQVDDSGLRQLVRREIVQRNSKSDPKAIHYEGLLEILEITPEEAAQFMGEDVIENAGVSSEQDLSEMSRDDLVSLAKSRGIKAPHQKKTEDLIQLLS
jgi:hypothetical protein